VPDELHGPVDERRARDVLVVVPPRGEGLHRARQQLGVDLHADAVVGRARGEVRRRVGVGREQARDHRRRLGLQPGDERADLRVGRVAEQRAPRLAVGLDEPEEGVDAGAQPLLPAPAAVGGGREEAEDLGRVGLEQRGVQDALGLEVLVDERLRDARGVGHVVQRRAVVAALGEGRLRGGEDHLAPLGGGHATTASGRHGEPPVGGGWTATYATPAGPAPRRRGATGRARD
jgi:hypothetical protein